MVCNHLFGVINVNLIKKFSKSLKDDNPKLLQIAKRWSVVIPTAFPSSIIFRYFIEIPDFMESSFSDQFFPESDFFNSLPE